MKYFSLPVLFILLVSLTQCRKADNDEKAPSIAIDLPAEGSVHRALDTVHIKGVVKDDRGVQRIVISLKNNKDSKILSSHSEFPGGVRTFSLDTDFLLDNIHLASGKYTLEIAAFDEENRSIAYIPIQVSEFPVQRKAVYVIVTKESSQQILELDSNDHLSHRYFVGGDYGGSVINSYDQRLYTIGSEKGELNLVDFDDEYQGAVKFRNEPDGTIDFETIAIQDREVYYSRRGGEIGGVNSSSAGIFDGEARPGYFAETILKHDDKLIAVEKNKTGPERKLFVYGGLSGVVLYGGTQVNQTTEMFSTDHNHVLMFFNTSSSSEIRLYNVDGNFFEFQKKTISGTETINGVAPIDATHYIVAVGKNLLLFNTGTFDTEPFAGAGDDFSYVTFDPVNREVWAVYKSAIEVYDLDNKTLIRTVFAGTTVNAVHILYNR